MTLAAHSFAHEAMTTRFEVIVSGQKQEYARQAAGAVFREIEHLERLLSRYDPGSDIGQVNLLAPGASVRVSADTMECIQAAQWVHDATGGLFDPTIGPLVQCWKRTQGNRSEPSDTEITDALKRTGMHRLLVNAAEFSLGWKTGTGSLDLGGIGKGFAIDKAAEILSDWGVDNAVISGGGSTALAIGNGPDGSGGWTLGVGGSWGEKVGCGSVILKNHALSGSGKEVKGDHIIHPRTGRPAATHAAAWAVARTASLSDGLATAFMMMPFEQIETLCTKHPGLGAFVVLPGGRISRTGVLG